MKNILIWIKTHKYCLAMLYFLFYLPCFFLLERLTEPIITIHCPIDNIIPFVPAFVLPYFLWYIAMPSVLIFFMLKDRQDFLRLCFTMFTGMTAALIIYATVPNGLDIRVPVKGNSIFEKICILLYSIDTPTNVCPSIHVSSTTSMALSVQHSAVLKKRTKAILHILFLLIIVSTMFIKQHSVYDVLSGMVLSLILWLISFRTDFKGRHKASL